MLNDPLVGIANTTADPNRLLGWVAYCGIESFGSIVIQSYWALVNTSVDVQFAKSYFGYIVACAQIGSILGPTVATQAVHIGIPVLFLIGAVCMVCLYRIDDYDNEKIFLIEVDFVVSYVDCDVLLYSKIWFR